METETEKENFEDEFKKAYKHLDEAIDCLYYADDILQRNYDVESKDSLARAVSMANAIQSQLIDVREMTRMSLDSIKMGTAEIDEIGGIDG